MINAIVTVNELVASVAVHDVFASVTVTEFAVEVSVGGVRGPIGPSAYAIAVEAGFVGDEAAWLASLVGAPGVDGDDGDDGAAGKSAYEIAVEAGFVGDEAAWLASLVGAPGVDGDDGDDGAAGKSAYEIAVDDGFVGDETAWLASLVGDPGANAPRSLTFTFPLPIDGALSTSCAISKFSGNITGYSIQAVGAAGAVTADVWKKASGVVPTVADKITSTPLTTSTYTSGTTTPFSATAVAANDAWLVTILNAQSATSIVVVIEVGP